MGKKAEPQGGLTTVNRVKCRKIWLYDTGKTEMTLMSLTIEIKCGKIISVN